MIWTSTQTLAPLGAAGAQRPRALRERPAPGFVGKPLGRPRDNDIALGPTL